MAPIVHAHTAHQNSASRSWKRKHVKCTKIFKHPHLLFWKFTFLLSVNHTLFVKNKIFILCLSSTEPVIQNFSSILCTVLLHGTADAFLSTKLSATYFNDTYFTKVLHINILYSLKYTSWMQWSNLRSICNKALLISSNSGCSVITPSVGKQANVCTVCSFQRLETQ